MKTETVNELKAGNTVLNMKEPELHYAYDRRCYNGAMCSDLQKEHVSKDNILKQIKKARPDYRCTYFPVEDKYLSFIYKTEYVPIQLTGNMFEDKGQCLLEAWIILVGGE